MVSRPETALPGLDIPLCVDLDGTLVKTDTLLEGMLALVRARPETIALFPIWLIRGRANLKREVAQRWALDVEFLPFNKRVRDYVFAERARGRTAILATAADSMIAEAVARSLGCFMAVLASDGKTNLKSGVKLAAIVQLCGPEFEYVGDSSADFEILAGSTRARIAVPNASLTRRLRRSGIAADTELAEPAPSWSILRMLRVSHWTKNALIVVPFATSHRLLDLSALRQAGTAMAAFSLLASGVYIVNDLMDLTPDRRHPRKRFRPLAAGTVKIGTALCLAAILTIAGLFLAGLVSVSFLAVAGLYGAATLAYSLYFKRRLFMDVALLSSLYTLRIVAGGVAGGITLSPWLTIFSIFFFLSLALAKRYAELSTMVRLEQTGAAGRAYHVEDRPVLAMMGIASAYLSALITAIYIYTPESQLLYKHPEWMWPICPILLYWISRIWLWAHRGKLSEVPVVFALRDRPSWILLLAIFAVMAIASR